MVGKRAAAVALITALLIAVVTAGEASAHANYESSTPAKGEVLAASPPQVEITFTQDVQKVTGTYDIAVTNSADAAVTAGPATLSDANRSVMSVPLQPALPPGRYVVRWTNVSDSDGDAAEGAFSFYAGVQPSAEDLAADEELAAVGQEDPTATAAAATPAPNVSPPATPPASSTVVAPGDGDDDGDGNSGWIIVGVIVAALVIAGGGALVWSQKRR